MMILCYPFFEPQLTTYHLNIGGLLRKVTELGTSSSIMDGFICVTSIHANRYIHPHRSCGYSSENPGVFRSPSELHGTSSCNAMENFTNSFQPVIRSSIWYSMCSERSEFFFFSFFLFFLYVICLTHLCMIIAST